MWRISTIVLVTSTIFQLHLYLNEIQMQVRNGSFKVRAKPCFQMNSRKKNNYGFWGTIYPKKYAHGFVVLCFVVVMQSFIMNSHEVFIHIHQGCFAGTGAIVRLPQCQWSKPDGYGKISQCKPQQSTAKQKPCVYFLGYTVFTHYLRLENIYARIKCSGTMIGNLQIQIASKTYEFYMNH